MPSLPEAVLDLVLPTRCVGCGSAGSTLCAACAPGPSSVRLRRLRGGPFVVAAGTYGGGLRQAVLAWKERGQVALRRPLAAALATSVTVALALLPSQTLPRRILLVPVPTARAAKRARGGDLLARLCAAAGVMTGLRTARGALRVEATVRDSAGLGRAERRRNLVGAFGARAGPSGVAALLVDDVVTTGATLCEAARALGAAGWPVLGAAVVAETPLLDGHRSGTGRRDAPSDCTAATHWQ